MEEVNDSAKLYTCLASDHATSVIVRHI